MKTLQKLLDSESPFFTTQILAGLWNVDPASAKTMASRLFKKGILLRLRRGLYALGKTKVFPFELANALYQPSYISLESALNYWGVLVQAPQVVLSVANRSKRLRAQNVEFIYRRIPKKCLEMGWQKEKNFVIATPEKAVLDLYYLASKGILSVRTQDLRLERINQDKLRMYVQFYPKAFQKKWPGLLKGRYEGVH